MKIERFITAKEAAGCSARTIQFYRAELSAAGAWLRAHGHDPDQADACAIEAHLAAERQRGQSPASVSARYRALSAYYRWTHARQRRPGDPEIAQVERPDTGHHEPRRTTPDQVEQLLASITPATWLDYRDRALIWIIFWSGLRVSEAAALRVEDIDQASHRLHIQAGKGDKGRPVPYHPGAAPDILGYLFSRPAPHAPQLWIGNNGAGGPRGALTDNGIRQMLRRRCKAAGMKAINPHSLRHGFAMEMLNNGHAPMEAVSRILGHSSPEITRRFYADYIDEEIGSIYTSAITRSGERRKK